MAARRAFGVRNQVAQSVVRGAGESNGVMKPKGELLVPLIGE